MNQDQHSNTDLQKQLQGLPKYWLNAKDVLRCSLPPLLVGEDRKQTVSKKGTIKLYFHGELCKWSSFRNEVLQFWLSKSMVGDLDRCANLPVWPDPNIEACNPNAMSAEVIQCGGEITVSGRFYSNVLGPIVHCVQTIAATGGSGPRDITFGDAWIRDERVLKQLPDIVGKVKVGKDLETRLVGEVKFPRTVDIAGMVRAAIEGKSVTAFRALLGQIVNYMLGHRLKFAFLTNYNATVCLQLSHFSTGDGMLMPRIAFSDAIESTHTADDGRISVRLALLYLVFQVFSDKEEHWRISEHTAKVVNDHKWLSTLPAPQGPLNTPMKNHADDSDTLSNRDSSDNDSDIIAPHIQTNPFLREQEERKEGYGKGVEIATLQTNEQAYHSPGLRQTPSKPPKDKHSAGHFKSSEDAENLSVRHRREFPLLDPGESTEASSKDDQSDSDIETATERIQNLVMSDATNCSAEDSSSTD